MPAATTSSTPPVRPSCSKRSRSSISDGLSVDSREVVASASSRAADSSARLKPLARASSGSPKGSVDSNIGGAIGVARDANAHRPRVAADGPLHSGMVDDTALQPPAVAASPRLVEGSAPARGLWLGVLGMTLFALTLPMTRLAVGPADAPQLPPAFVSFGRAALAAGFSLAWIAATRAPFPPRRLWPAIAVCAAGTVLGFPLFLGFALRDVDAVHAAVVTGLLPLATAAVAALALRQRAPPAFWAWAVAGSALVLVY